MSASTDQLNGATELSKFGYRQELRRALRLRDLVVYGLIFMIPIAPFAIFGVVYNLSHGMVPLVYLIGLVAMLFTALSYREMSRAFPIAGSVYSYAGRGINGGVGFVAGWAVLLDYLLLPTLIYVFAADAMNAALPGVPPWVWVVAFVAINTVANLLGVRITKRVNLTFLVGQMLVLVVFVVFAVVAISKGVNGAQWSALPLFNPTEFFPGLVFAGLSVAVLSFLGFDAISTQAEEVEGGSRMVGRATVLCLVLAAVMFIVQTYLAALLIPGSHPLAAGDAENQAFYHVAGIAGGQWLAVVSSIAWALAAGLACSVAVQNATSRLLYSMARDGNLPRFLSHVNERTRVPERAILLVAVVSLILGLGFVGQVEFLASLVNFGALLGFLLLHVSVVSYYLIKRRQRTFGMHLVVPLIGFVIIGYVLVEMDAHAKIGGLIWLAIGLVVIIVRKATGRRVVLDLSAAEGQPSESSA